MRRTRPHQPISQPKPVPKPQPQARASRTGLWIALALLAITFLLYAQVRHFDFVNFDDPDYVTANPHVRAGLTASGLAWAFTSTEAANWFPLTRIAHMLDCQFFGLDAGWHHLSNLFWHSLAALMLFLFLQRATRAPWAAAFVAAIFALHPLHVESVAWIAERKDVLSAFFWFLALWLYVRYTEQPGAGRYAMLLGAFCLGLMAKPMVVTLPFVLLLLDGWPLGRMQSGRVVPLVREKLPLFAISAVASIATYLAQRGSGAVEALSAFPLSLRIENALVSYATYIARMFWPSDLAVFYPYPGSIPWWQALVAGAAIAAITAMVLRYRRDRPYLAAGWLWYLGTLVPVIGIVQVGAQSHADRYMYIPMVGLTIMLAWGAAEIARLWPRLRLATATVGAAACLAMALLTWAQAAYWENSRSLFQHALDVTTGNYVAHHNLGLALAATPEGLPAAIEHYQAALRIQPNSAKVHTDLGSALAQFPDRLPEAIVQYEAAIKLDLDSAIPHSDLGNALAKSPNRLPEAITEYQTALRLQPNFAEAHNNLGSALAKSGRLPAAIAEFQAALNLDPGYTAARNNLHRALSSTPGSSPEAIAEYEEALRLNPNDAEAHTNLAQALAQMPGRLAEAIPHYRAAVKLQPSSAEAHYNLGAAFSKMPNRMPEAIPEFEAALRLRPDYAEAHNNLGVVLSQAGGKTNQAIAHFEAALRSNPNYADAHYNLGVALAEIPGRLPEAIRHFEAALRLHPDPELQKVVDRLRSGKN